MKQSVVPKSPVYKQQDLLLLLLQWHKHGLNIVPHKEGGQVLHTQGGGDGGNKKINISTIIFRAIKYIDNALTSIAAAMMLLIGYVHIGGHIHVANIQNTVHHNQYR